MMLMVALSKVSFFSIVAAGSFRTFGVILFSSDTFISFDFCSKPAFCQTSISSNNLYSLFSDLFNYSLIFLSSTTHSGDFQSFWRLNPFPKCPISSCCLFYASSINLLTFLTQLSPDNILYSCSTSS